MEDFPGSASAELFQTQKITKHIYLFMSFEVCDDKSSTFWWFESTCVVPLRKVTLKKETISLGTKYNNFYRAISIKIDFHNRTKPKWTISILSYILIVYTERLMNHF